MTDECCMLGCHGPVAETQMVPTLIDGEMVEIAYPLCQRCVDLSARWGRATSGGDGVMTDYTAEDLEVYRAACEARERHASEACPVCGHAVETPADTT